MSAPRLSLITLALCVTLCVFLSHATAQEPAPTRTLFVTVTDKKGNFVRGLKKEDFAVHDGRRRLEPASLAEAGGPATVGLVLDASGSTWELWGKVGKGKSGNLREALAHFFARSHPGNEYFVVAFNHQPLLFVEDTSDTREVLAAVERLGAAKPKGLTALYDALHLALDRSARGRHRKRVLLVFTDGHDTVSKLTFNKLRRALGAADVLVYGVGMRSYRPAGSGELEYAWRSVLSEMSERTGGAALFPQGQRGLLAAADYLVAELSSQYALAYAPGPPEKRDGWHELKVKLNELRDEKGKRLEFDVRVRRGFYDEGAPRSESPARDSSPPRR